MAAWAGWAVCWLAWFAWLASLALLALLAWLAWLASLAWLALLAWLACLAVPVAFGFHRFSWFSFGFPGSLVFQHSFSSSLISFTFHWFLVVFLGLFPGFNGVKNMFYFCGVFLKLSSGYIPCAREQIL